MKYPARFLICLFTTTLAHAADRPSAVSSSKPNILFIAVDDLRPAFAGESVARAQPSFWEHEGKRAIRIGQ